MILQALNSYYQRLSDAGQNIPPFGFSQEKIHFELVLAPGGKLLRVSNLQITSEKGKQLEPKSLHVPKDKDRTSGVHPFFSWDKTAYVLGADEGGKSKRLQEQFKKFKALQHKILGNSDDLGAQALLSFLDSWNPLEAKNLTHWSEFAGKNVVFRLEGEEGFLHQRKAFINAWLAYLGSQPSGQEGFCLVSGQIAPISETHPFFIRGVKGAQSSGAALISFNADAFTSYNKNSSYNSPVGELTAFNYITTLNHLLIKGSRQRIQVGDATTVFWSEKPTKVEAFFAAAMGGAADEESTDAHDSNLLADLRHLLESLRQGGRTPSWDVDPQTPFYILGLSPNAARISVRFWHVATVKGIMHRLAEHYKDLEIESRYENEPKYPGMFRLLLETVPARKKDDGRIEREAKNIQPLFGGELMRAVLTGGEYPRSLLSKIIGRFRADGEVTYLRAALIKAHFSRLARQGKPSKEVSVSLDPNCTNIGYLLGRLFAVLEKAQQDALPGINATIKDRFFGAASATPRAVFPQLIRLAQHHISKAEYGYVADRLLAKISEKIDACGVGFPAHLSLENQGMFALGYYHQRNDNYRKNEDKLDPIKEN